jgi:hypothetical protein
VDARHKAGHDEKLFASPVGSRPARSSIGQTSPMEQAMSPIAQSS